MIYDGVITKPPLEEVIEHGWLKDAAAKAHKYIERWRGKNGKWYYSYKSKAQEKVAKAKRVMNGYEADEVSDFRTGHQTWSKKQQADWKSKWRQKGLKKAYKTRKSQMATARTNANLAYRNDPKQQYKTRSSQVKEARANAKIAAKRREVENANKAEAAYKDRKAQTKLARGNAHRAYGRKTLGKLGYEKAMGGSQKNKVLKEFRQTVDGKWVKKKKR